MMWREIFLIIFCRLLLYHICLGSPTPPEKMSLTDLDGLLDKTSEELKKKTVLAEHAAVTKGVKSEGDHPAGRGRRARYSPITEDMNLPDMRKMKFHHYRDTDDYGWGYHYGNRPREPIDMENVISKLDFVPKHGGDSKRGMNIQKVYGSLSEEPKRGLQSHELFDEAKTEYVERKQEVEINIGGKGRSKTPGLKKPDMPQVNITSQQTANKSVNGGAEGKTNATEDEDDYNDESANREYGDNDDDYLSEKDEEDGAKRLNGSKQSPKPEDHMQHVNITRQDTSNKTRILGRDEMHNSTGDRDTDDHGKTQDNGSQLSYNETQSGNDEDEDDSDIHREGDGANRPNGTGTSPFPEKVSQNINDTIQPRTNQTMSQGYNGSANSTESPSSGDDAADFENNESEVGRIINNLKHFKSQPDTESGRNEEGRNGSNLELPGSEGGEMQGISDSGEPDGIYRDRETDKRYWDRQHGGNVVKEEEAKNSYWDKDSSSSDEQPSKKYWNKETVRISEDKEPGSRNWKEAQKSRYGYKRTGSRNWKEAQKSRYGYKKRPNRWLDKVPQSSYGYKKTQSKNWKELPKSVYGYKKRPNRRLDKVPQSSYGYKKTQNKNWKEAQKSRYGYKRTRSKNWKETQKSRYGYKKRPNRWLDKVPQSSYGYKKTQSKNWKEAQKSRYGYKKRPNRRLDKVPQSSYGYKKTKSKNWKEAQKSRYGYKKRPNRRLDKVPQSSYGYKKTQSKNWKEAQKSRYGYKKRPNRRLDKVPQSSYGYKKTQSKNWKELPKSVYGYKKRPNRKWKGVPKSSYGYKKQPGSKWGKKTGSRDWEKAPKIGSRGDEPGSTNWNEDMGSIGYEMSGSRTGEEASYNGEKDNKHSRDRGGYTSTREEQGVNHEQEKPDGSDGEIGPNESDKRSDTVSKESIPVRDGEQKEEIRLRKNGKTIHRSRKLLASNHLHGISSHPVSFARENRSVPKFLGREKHDSVPKIGIDNQIVYVREREKIHNTHREKTKTLVNHAQDIL